MKLTYTLTDEDTKKYINTNFNKKRTTIPKIIVFLGSIMLFTVAIVALIAKDYLVTIAITIFLSLIYIIIRLPKAFKKQYIKSTCVKGEKTILINEAGLSIIDDTRSTTHKYNSISSIELINDSFILIKFKHGDSFIIPQSAFSTQSEMITFINRIKTNANIL